MSPKCKKVGDLPFKILIRNPTGNRSFGMSRRRLEYNIRMDFNEIGVETRNSVDLPQDRDYWRALVNAALNLGVL